MNLHSIRTIWCKALLGHRKQESCEGKFFTNFIGHKGNCSLYLIIATEFGSVFFFAHNIINAYFFIIELMPGIIVTHLHSQEIQIYAQIACVFIFAIVNRKDYTGHMCTNKQQQREPLGTRVAQYAVTMLSQDSCNLRFHCNYIS